MTARNSILLIIRQNDGMDYNTLLNKISGNYSSINSAMAALSRAIKDLAAMGYVVRKGSRLYATERATTLIYSEMRNKLLMRLNQIVKSKNSSREIDTIVEHLQTLIERSKGDSDLLRAARGSTEFSIGDLEKIGKELDERIRHLSYIAGIFSSQISSLKELDFNDSVLLPADKKSLAIVRQIAEKTGAKDFSAEIKNEAFLAELEKSAGNLGARVKGTTVQLPVSSLKGFLEMAVKQNESRRGLYLMLHLPPLLIRLAPGVISVEGPYSRLEETGGRAGRGSRAAERRQQKIIKKERRKESVWGKLKKQERSPGGTKLQP